MPQKNSHNQIKHIEIFKFVQKIFEHFYDDDTIFSIFTDSLNSNLNKESFNSILYEKYFLDIRKCLNILEKEILNGNELIYISCYRNNIFYNQLDSTDFLKDVYGFLVDKGEIEPHALYPNLKKRELQETPPRTFKKLFIEEKYSYFYIQPENTTKYFQKNKLSNIITEIINTIEKNQIAKKTLQDMPQKNFLLTFEKNKWHISFHQKNFIWKLFCS